MGLEKSISTTDLQPLNMSTKFSTLRVSQPMTPSTTRSFSTLRNMASMVSTLPVFQVASCETSVRDLQPSNMKLVSRKVAVSQPTTVSTLRRVSAPWNMPLAEVTGRVSLPSKAPEVVGRFSSVFQVSRPWTVRSLTSALPPSFSLSRMALMDSGSCSTPASSTYFSGSVPKRPSMEPATSMCICATSAFSRLGRPANQYSGLMTWTSPTNSMYLISLRL